MSEQDEQKSGASSDSPVNAAANATGEAGDKVEAAAAKVETAAASAGDDFTRKTLEEIKAGLGGIGAGLDRLADEIRSMKPAKEEATPAPSSESTETMTEPEVPASPAPAAKVKKGTYHKRKAKTVARRGGKK
jgi:hypothetical protein